MKRIICLVLCVAMLCGHNRQAAAQKNTVTPEYGGCTMVDQYGHYADENYTFLQFNVAGVTFKNGRRGRQTILREIYWKDEPYETVEIVRYVDTEWEGSPAIEVWVESETASEMIGYVPKTEVAFFHENFESMVETTSFEVVGGGKDIDGEKIPFGAKIIVKFKNTEKTILQEAEWEKAARERKEREEKEKKQRETEARRKAIQRQIEAEEAAAREKKKATIKKVIIAGVVLVVAGLIAAGWK